MSNSNKKKTGNVHQLTPESTSSSDDKQGIDQIRALVTDEMQSVNSQIKTRLASDVALVNQLGHYIVGSGGKRLRPLLVLLSASAFGYKGPHHITLAAVIEFIHTATLLHDDVVDESELRRGRQTANALWGNEASVLVGDFLYSRAFQMMVEAGSIRIMEILADTTNIIAEGEVQQLLNIHDPDTTQEIYLQVIRSKTAKLFEAGVRIGAVLTGQATSTEEAIANYGMHLGTAFQLIDDVLDYQATTDVLGKNIGDDLAEGKPTLPLIHVMQHGSTEQVILVRDAIIHGGRERIQEVMQAIESTKALEYTTKIAKAEAQLAIEAIQAIPDSKYKQAMIDLAKLSVDRNY